MVTLYRGMAGVPHVQLRSCSSSDDEFSPRELEPRSWGRRTRVAAGACVVAAGLAVALWGSEGPPQGSRSSPSPWDEAALDAVSRELVQLSGRRWRPGTGPQEAGNILRGLQPGLQCGAPEPSHVCQGSGWQCQRAIFADRDDCSIVSINLVMRQQNLDAMNTAPKKKVPQPCDVIVNYRQTGEMHFTGAFVKYKGATGSFMGCVNEMTGKATSCWRACRKLSLKVDLRKASFVGPDERPAREVLGMTQMQLMGMMHDDSLVRNHIGYKIQQDLGLITPCSIPANVFINGLYDGVSDLTEGIDDVYIAGRFPGVDGTLWVEMWPESTSAEFYRTVEGISGFAGRKMVHEGPDGPGYELLADFAREAKACADSGRLCTKARAARILEKYTYPESFIKGFLGAVLSANSDTPLMLKHNFYLYIQHGRFYYLLWDFNQVLYDITGSPVPGYEVARPWYQILTPGERKKFCPYDVPSSGSDLAQRRFSHFTCEPVGYIMGLAWKDEFLARVRDLDQERLRRQVRNEINVWSKRLRSSVVCDAENGGWPPVDRMTEETAAIIAMFLKVSQFWEDIANNRLQSWPHPTFSDFPREITECFFDGMQTAQYLGHAALTITASVRDCPHGPPAMAVCSTDISNVLASFSFVGSFLSGMLVHCPVRDVTGLAQRGNGRLYYSGPHAECAQMTLRLTAGLASVSAGASGLSEMCFPGVALAKRGFPRRLVSTGFVQDRPTEIATCTFDAIGATLWLAEAAIAIDRASKTCNHFYRDRSGCSRDVSNVIEAFAYLGTFTANSVAQCAREATFGRGQAFEATCAADISQLVGALASIAEGGSGMAHSCGHAGDAPFRSRIVTRRHRHLEGEDYTHELGNAREAWSDVLKGDHGKLRDWLNRLRVNKTVADVAADPSAPFQIFG